MTIYAWNFSTVNVELIMSKKRPGNKQFLALRFPEFETPLTQKFEKSNYVRNGLCYVTLYLLRTLKIMFTFLFFYKKELRI
jgi:hypothetical protein